MSSQFIVIDKSGGWANAVIVKSRDGRTNKVFNSSEEAYKTAEQFEDGIALGDIEASDERVYTKAQILEFKEKLQDGLINNPANGYIIDEFTNHFELKG